MMNATMKKAGIVAGVVLLTGLTVLAIRLGLNGFRFDQINLQSLCVDTLKANAVMYLGYYAAKKAETANAR